jgi:hypothetical protein
MPSFVGWSKYGQANPKKSPRFFLLPEDFETEEESLGLYQLDLWRQALDSLAVEG